MNNGKINGWKEKTFERQMNNRGRNCRKIKKTEFREEEEKDMKRKTKNKWWIEMCMRLGKTVEKMNIKTITMAERNVPEREMNGKWGQRRHRNEKEKQKWRGCKEKWRRE